MNILLLTTRLNFGGIGIYTTSLACSLKKKGHNVIVASSGGELIERLKKNAIEHIYIPVDTSAEIDPHVLVSYLRLSRVIRERGIQIIHAQTRVTQVIASLLSVTKRIGFVTTCHGFFKKRVARRIFPCWGRRVIAISEAVERHLSDDLGVPKEKVRLIYNGIDMRRFNRAYSEKAKSLIIKEYGLSDVPTVGIISRLSDVKGHKYLLGAFAKVLSRISNLQLLIIGDGPAAYLEELKSLARKLGIEDRVVFHGSVEDTSIPLSIMDVFCLPSIQEGLGLSILEAMAMGVPVVASDVGGISTLIKDARNGLLVPPRDEDRLAEAILHILCDNAMAEEMGRLSKKIAQEKFTLDMMTDRVLRVYEEVTS